MILFWKFVENIVKSYPDAKVIITSRNLAVAHVGNGEYRDEIFQSAEAFRAATLQWRPPIGFLEFVVLPLTDDEIAEFVDRCTPELMKHFYRQRIAERY